MQTNFPLVNIYGDRHSISRRLTYAQTLEAKIGSVILAALYVLIYADVIFDLNLNVIPFLLFAIVSLVLAFFPFDKNSGKVIFTKKRIQVINSGKADQVQQNNIMLDNIDSMEIFTVRKFRFISNLILLHGIIKEGEK